jgi:LacI family transcriptional regulator
MEPRVKRGRVTVIDVARAAGVSKSTVSLVLQGSSVITEETAVKVKDAIRELGYVYNRGAANLRQASPSKMIGIVVNDLTNSFFAELAVGVDMIVQSANSVQILAHSGEDVDRQTVVINSMREHGIAGLILCPARGTQPSDLKPLVAAGLPVVVAVRNVPGAKVSSLLSDNYAGVKSAVRHLVELGHRRIAFLGGFPDIQVFTERFAGYRDGLIDAGITPTDALMVTSAPSRAGGVEAVRSLMARGGHPATAAVCFNDAVAFGACDGLRSIRLEPGVDFSVVGFDDVIEARSTVPALTTVSVNPLRMGQQAAQLLFKQINAGRAEIENIRTSVRLVVRQSTGRPLTAMEMESAN